MKELSNKEKALDAVRQMVADGQVSQDVAEKYFPELKASEDEDERIRKELISFFTERAKYTEDSTFNGLSSKEIISWLEKQGEPKFNVGDWVVDNNGVVKQILSYKDGVYKHTDGYSATIFEDEWRLWDITEDAKSGDVLVSNDASFIVIFKGLSYLEDDIYRFKSYCYYREGIFSPIEDSNWCCNAFHPSTKEQRDTFEKAMADAGYTFDFEKKELKKIHNALEECEIENIEHGKYYYCIKDYFAGGKKQASKGDVVQALRGLPIMALGVKANEYFLPINSIKQSHAWSEEDENTRKKIIKFLKEQNYFDGKANEFKEPYKKEYEWLKSIKDRYTWKPSDIELEVLRLAAEKDGICLMGLYEKLKNL